MELSSTTYLDKSEFLYFIWGIFNMSCDTDPESVMKDKLTASFAILCLVLPVTCSIPSLPLMPFKTRALNFVAA